MTDKEIIGKVHAAVYRQCRNRGYAAPVDVLMDIGVLSKQNYENWRFGRIPYLEAVCSVNLQKLSFILHQMRVYAQKAGLKPSFTCYKQWGVKRKLVRAADRWSRSRFSKSGDPGVERWYATHFVDSTQISHLKSNQSG